MHRLRLVSLFALFISSSAFADEPATRHFHMGFTPFPYDISVEAVHESHKFIRDNADILAHHIEGVPWAEALNNKPFSKELIGEWTCNKNATPKGGKVYVAVSPGRGDLKPAEKAAPFPKELAGKSYDDPQVKKAYLAHCRKAVEFFKPDYLAIGIEVNEIFAAGEGKWRAYVKLHEHVYRELKKEHSKLPICASFTLHGLLNLRGKAQADMVAAFKQLMPFNDLIAVSFYPFIAGGTTDIDGAFKRLTDWFDEYKKPYAMVETGEAAERLQFSKSKQVVAGTPEKQRHYYDRLLNFAQERRFAFVISFLHRDYDALWTKIEKTAPEVFIAWRDCGLLDELGKPRPAYEVWHKYFHR